MVEQKKRQPFSLRRFLLGSSLATHEMQHQTIGKTVGLAVFASDALSSTAYATEEILFVLATAGTAFFFLSFPISLAIAILLIILTISYRQTVFAYPNGGGAYTVAHDNFGERAAQTAGAALLTDYILTVSVSIAAGVAQITSAFPALLAWRVEISVALIFLMLLINLRGVRESGKILSVPTYFFLATMIGTLIIGFYKLFTGNLAYVTGIHTETTVVSGLTIFLLLRAFASGSVAVTGTEAISNGITAFKEPKSRNAAMTMAWMSALLGIMFISITILALHIHAIPTETETIISQLARTIYGPGFMHLLVLAATTIILIMAANTSFADFPRLSALHAKDGFLPRQLTYRGSRLVFSWGMVILAIISSFLVIIFQARVTALIPLYAIGVFLSFTISQAGMVVRWLKISRLKKNEIVATKGLDLQYDPKWRRKLIVNAVGALVTFIVMTVQAITKFTQGAWIVIVLIPAFVWIFFRIHRHYKSVAEQLSLNTHIPPPVPKEKTLIILVSGMHQGTLKAVGIAKTLHAAHIKAVHIAIDEEEGELVKKKWKQYVQGINLDIIPSPYRELVNPILQYIDEIERKWKDNTVIVVMPEFVPTKFWHHFLHTQTALQIRWALEHREDVEILDVPYRLRDERGSIS